MNQLKASQVGKKMKLKVESTNLREPWGFSCYKISLDQPLMFKAAHLRKITVCLITAILAFPCSSLQAQNALPLQPEKRLNLSGGEQGHATISVKQPRLRLGETTSVDYTFYNTRSSYWVYNWNFIRLVPLPGQLAIYDAEKRYLGDLIRFTSGSRTTVGSNSWLFLYEGSHVGTSIGFKVGYIPGARNRLPPGRYFIQLILAGAFLSNPQQVRWDSKAALLNTEAIRSNVIAIEIVE